MEEPPRRSMWEQIALIQERQKYALERLQSLAKRVDELEEGHTKLTTMLNRIGGAFGLVVGIGVFVGWVFSVGSNVLRWMGN